jgi:hypothetical protein
VRGLKDDIEQTLYKGLGILGPKGQTICKELAEERPNVASKREDLQNQLSRLLKASKELVQIGC